MLRRVADAPPTCPSLALHYKHCPLNTWWSLVDDDITQYGTKQPTVSRRNSTRLDEDVPAVDRLMTREVDTGRERGGERHITGGDGLAVSRGRGDSRPGPHTTDRVVD